MEHLILGISTRLARGLEGERGFGEAAGAIPEAGQGRQEAER
jgi:hypothetical protein